MDFEEQVVMPGGRIVVVADASDSAVSHWSQIAFTVGALLPALSEIYVLGCEERLAPEYFAEGTANFPYRQARHCSLIAPILEDLNRRYRPADALIVVGSGEVWDLADWVESPMVGQWLMLRVGPDSLQGGDLAIPEYTAGELEAALIRLRSGDLQRRPPRPAQESFWVNVSCTWDIDRSGFPLIYVEPLEAFVHLFPITKAQFERFLAEDNPPEWSDTAYGQLLACNPRTAPDQIRPRPYEQMLLTGIVPEEVPAFARWLGQEYELLDLDEWCTARRWLAGQQATAPPPDLTAQGLSIMAGQTWQALLSETQAATLLDLSLMVNGIVEWVYNPAAVRPAQQYVGMGLPRSSFFHTTKAEDEPLRPIDTTRRMRHFGFRLIRRRQ